MLPVPIGHSQSAEGGCCCDERLELRRNETAVYTTHTWGNGSQLALENGENVAKWGVRRSDRGKNKSF